MSTTKLMQEIGREFEGLFSKVTDAVYVVDPEIGTWCFTENFSLKLDDFLHSAQTRLLEGVVQEIEEELEKWNCNGEYYENVTTALSDIISKLKSDGK